MFLRIQLNAYILLGLINDVDFSSCLSTMNFYSVAATCCITLLCYSIAHICAICINMLCHSATYK